MTDAPEPTDDDLAKLLALADTDGQIRRLRRTLDDLPEQRDLDEAEARLQQLNADHGDKTLERDQIQSEASREDKQVELLRERLAAEQQRLYGGDITNAKELQSMKAEIASVEDRIDQHETAELDALERVEQIEAEMAVLTQATETTKAEIAELTVARDEAAKSLLAQIAELEVSVNAQRGPIPDALLGRYDTAAERFGALAIGRLDDDRCTACGISLSYADVNELIEGPSLTTCPSCQRLMVVV